MMRTQFELLSEENLVKDAAAIAVRTGQESFPILRDGKVAGILDGPSLHRATSRKDFARPVMDYAVSDYAMATPGEDLTSARDLMAQTGQMALPVFGSRMARSRFRYRK